MKKNRNHPSMIGIVGSPRRGGNTEILVDEVLTGAQETGAHTRKYILNELHIAPCQGCGGCHKTHKCVQEDDMKKLRRIWISVLPGSWGPPSTGEVLPANSRCS